MTMAIAIEYLPATLDLQDGLSSAGDGDILEVAALEVKLHARGRSKSPRPQGSIDGPSLLHGLNECDARPEEWSGSRLEVVRSRDGVSQVRTARDSHASPDSECAWSGFSLFTWGFNSILLEILKNCLLRFFQYDQMSLNESVRAGLDFSRYPPTSI